jgi:quercetin dioxygenase-like cupin family protein
MRRQFITQNGITIRNNGAAIRPIAAKAANNNKQRNHGFRTHEPFNITLNEIFSLAHKSNKTKIPIIKTKSPGEITKKPILTASASYDGTPYSYPAGQAEISLLKVVVPAYTPLPIHTHPMPNAGYVLSGSIVLVNEETEEKRIYHAGEGIPEMVGTRHSGYALSDPCVLIVFYAGVVGQKLSDT